MQSVGFHFLQLVENISKFHRRAWHFLQHTLLSLMNHDRRLRSRIIRIIILEEYTTTALLQP